MASAPESPSISKWPSGGDLATRLAATTPPAPGMFSTTNGLPIESDNFAASNRASTSELPPGPAAAISRTVRDGYASSCAGASDRPANARADPRITDIQRTVVASCSFVRNGPLRLAPNIPRQFHHEPELLLLHLGRDWISGIDAGEAALRAYSQMFGIDEAGGLVHALLERVF